MEVEITDQYNYIQTKLKYLTTEKNMSDILKIEKRCTNVYNDVKNLLDSNKIKTTKINCFNWFYIYLNILEHEKDCYLSKSVINKSAELTYKSKDYIIAQNNRRIYKIVPKQIDMVNNSINYDYYADFCIYNIIENFKTDALSRDNFSYFPDRTQLILIFIEQPSEEICDEIRKNNIIPMSMKEIKKLTKIQEPTIINIDINIIINLCSGINDLTENSQITTDILTHKIFIGYNTDDISKMNNSELCEYIKIQNLELINEINSYSKIIICKSAMDKVSEIMNLYGSAEEKYKFDNLKNIINYELVMDEEFDLIEKYESNKSRYFHAFEKNVFKTGHIYDAITFTSNHRYVDFLLSKNIFINMKYIPSLFIMYKINHSLQKKINN
jgi:hypothetical protein